MFVDRPSPARRLAVALLLGALLAGCGGGEDDDPVERQSAPTPAATATTTAPDRGPAPDPGFGAPRVGQCHQMTPAQSRASVAGGRRVSCARPHTTVVAHVGYLAEAVSPRTPVERRRAIGRRLCEPALRRTVGGTLADRASSLVAWTLFTPDRRQLDRGARWVRCDVLARSGDGLVPLPETRPLFAQGVPEPLRVCQDAGGADISCSSEHVFRLEAVFTVVGREYPEPDSYTTVARERCQELTGEPGGYWQPPSRSGWDSGDRFVRCLTRTG